MVEGCKVLEVEAEVEVEVEGGGEFQIQSPTTLAICLEVLILCTEDVSLLSVPLDVFPATIRMCVLLTENMINILWLLFSDPCNDQSASPHPKT